MDIAWAQCSANQIFVPPQIVQGYIDSDSRRLGRFFFSILPSFIADNCHFIDRKYDRIQRRSSELEKKFGVYLSAIYPIFVPQSLSPFECLPQISTVREREREREREKERANGGKLYVADNVKQICETWAPYTH